MTMKVAHLVLVAFTISLFKGTETKRFHLRLPHHHISTPSTHQAPPAETSPVGYTGGSIVPSATIPTGSKFDVRSYGAVGDGFTDDTEAFKMAWDGCCQTDKHGFVLVPHGYSFLVRPTTFEGPCKSSIVFQIEGRIMAPDGPESWPRNENKRQWLVFYKISGMTMQGHGVIDGRGQKWWNLPCKPHKGMNGSTPPGRCDSPVAIRFFESSRLTVQGLLVKDSPQFNFRFDDCRDVHVEKLSIQAPALSPNTDGIHIRNSQNVIIHHSLISTGDDCVSIGTGCSNIDIHNMTCGPSHGISIGSLGVGNSRACVTNVTVRNSVIRHSDNGVRIKTWQGGYGSVSEVRFDNIHMENVRNPIIIDQYYCLTKNCPNQTSAVSISDIRYTNIKGTYNIRNPPVHFACSDSVPCTKLILSEVHLLPAEGRKVEDPFCWKAYGSMHSAIPPLFCLLDGSHQFMGQTNNDSC